QELQEAPEGRRTASDRKDRQTAPLADALGGQEEPQGRSGFLQLISHEESLLFQEAPVSAVLAGTGVFSWNGVAFRVPFSGTLDPGRSSSTRDRWRSGRKRSRCRPVPRHEDRWSGRRG